MCLLCIFCSHVIDVLRSHRPAKMTDVKGQEICSNFCFKFGNKASETHRMLKETLGDNAVGQTQTYERFKVFRDGMG